MFRIEATNEDGCQLWSVLIDSWEDVILAIAELADVDPCAIGPVAKDDGGDVTLRVGSLDFRVHAIGRRFLLFSRGGQRTIYGG